MLLGWQPFWGALVQLNPTYQALPLGNNSYFDTIVILIFCMKTLDKSLIATNYHNGNWLDRKCIVLFKGAYLHCIHYDSLHCWPGYHYIHTFCTTF